MSKDFIESMARQLDDIEANRAAQNFELYENRPHVVMVCDPVFLDPDDLSSVMRTVRSVSGTYPDAMSALAASEEISQDLNQDEDPPFVVFSLPLESAEWNLSDDHPEL